MLSPHLMVAGTKSRGSCGLLVQSSWNTLTDLIQGKRNSSELRLGLL